MKTTDSGPYQRLITSLRDARRERGITQDELAAQLQRPQSFVSKVESGERRLDVVEFLEMAQAIGCDPIALIAPLVEQRKRGLLP